LFRLVFKWSISLGGWAVPFWINCVALFVFAYLAYEGFRQGQKSQGEEGKPTSEVKIPRQLAAILAVLGLEWNSLFDKSTADPGESRNKVLAWLYRILDTLDSKTGHLLGFAALLLAAQTFLARSLVEHKQTPLCISIVVLLLLGFPLAAGISGFRVFEVKWAFFGKVPETVYTEDIIKEEMRELAKLCDRRFETNRWTYRLCWLSTAAFIVTLVLALTVVIVYGPSAQK